MARLKYFVQEVPSDEADRLWDDLHHNGERPPHGFWASIGTPLRSALRGALTLCVEFKGKFFYLDTDIERGVPPIVRARTEQVRQIIKRKALALSYGYEG